MDNFDPLYGFTCEFSMPVPIFYCNLSLVRSLDGHLVIKQRQIIPQAACIVVIMCAYKLFVYRRAGVPTTYGPLS